MWEINNAAQLISFARSLGLGAIICCLYDILRAFRGVIKFSTLSIFFQDIIFSVFSAFLTFTFLLSVTNGELRGYFFLGATLGFVVFRCSISIVVFRLLRYIIDKGKCVFLWFSKFFYTLFDTISKNTGDFFKKSLKLLKKLLKKQWYLLYTKGNRKFRS